MGALGLNVWTLEYHLAVLEREGLLRAVRKGHPLLYYPREDPRPKDHLHEVQSRIVKAVGERPGLSVRRLAGVLGVPRHIAYYHTQKLGTQGQVVLHREPLVARVYPRSASEGPRTTDPPRTSPGAYRGPSRLPSLPALPRSPAPAPEQDRARFVPGEAPSRHDGARLRRGPDGPHSPGTEGPA